MRADQLKGFIAAERKNEKEEAKAKQENPKEGRMTAGPDETGGGGQGEGAYGCFQLGESGGARSDRVWGGLACGGIHVAGSGHDTQGGKGLPCHQPRVINVE